MSGSSARVAELRRSPAASGVWRHIRRRVRRFRRHHLRWPGWLPRPPAQVVVPLVALVLALGLWGLTRLATARNELQQASTQMQLAREAVLDADSEAAEAALSRVDDHLAAAEGAAGALPLRALRVVPLVGSPVRAVEAGVAAGGHIASAGALLASVVDDLPTSGRVGVDGHDLSALHRSAVASSDALTAAGVELDAAAAALDGPRGAALPMVSSAASNLLADVADVQQQLDGAGRGLALLGDLTAPTTDARLLVLSQDTMELRATGGFVGSFGVINFSGGTVELERYDSFDVLPPPEPPMDPPAALARALPRWWGISNVNWWPDFPYTASYAREMFARQGGGNVDGVLAITESALARLVGVLGPIQVPGYAEPVVEDGFADRVLYEVELKDPPDTPKKRFLTELSRIVFDRLFSLPAERVGAVVDALDTSVGASDVQLWFADPGRQRQVAGTAWSGALPHVDGDFLMLVDSNMTASKANRDLVRDVTYEVDRTDDGDLVSTLTVRYRNQGEEYAHNPYYNGYLRVYVPRGSELLTDRAAPEGPAPDAPYDVFAANVYVEPLGEQTVELSWRLPSSVDAGDYSLTWLRQPGTPADSTLAVIGGQQVGGSDTAPSIEVDADLSGNPIADWLHDRWIGRRLGF